MPLIWQGGKVCIDARIGGTGLRAVESALVNSHTATLRIYEVNMIESSCIHDRGEGHSYLCSQKGILFIETRGDGSAILVYCFTSKSRNDRRGSLDINGLRMEFECE